MYRVLRLHHLVTAYRLRLVTRRVCWQRVGSGLVSAATTFRNFRRSLRGVQSEWIDPR